MKRTLQTECLAAAVYLFQAIRHVLLFAKVADVEATDDCLFDQDGACDDANARGFVLFHDELRHFITEDTDTLFTMGLALEDGTEVEIRWDFTEDTGVLNLTRPEPRTLVDRFLDLLLEDGLDWDQCVTKIWGPWVNRHTERFGPSDFDHLLGTEQPLDAA